MRPARRVSLRDARGVLLVALVFDSTASGFWVRGTGGAAPGEAGTGYRMNAWDGDGLTPPRGALVPNKKEPRGNPPTTWLPAVRRLFFGAHLADPHTSRRQAVA